VRLLSCISKIGGSLTLKILFITDTLGAGGKERRLTELMQALKISYDIEFELVVMSIDIHYKAIIDLGIKIHYILRKTKNDMNVFFRLYRLCKNYKPDIVHCWDSMTAIYIAPTCKLLGIKLVNGMVMDSPTDQNIYNKHWLRARLTFPFSDYIVGNSKAGLIAYRAPGRKSEVIYNGFNFDRTKSLVDKEIIKDQLGVGTEYLIGMVATFWEKKDYATYYKAAQLLLVKRKDITFMAIGADTDSAESRALIDKKYIDNFRFLGKRSEIESFINAMDICILSTFTEGISNSILEYMALGKPVIATRGGGTIEILKDKETGFLIEPSNPVELAGKVEMLLNDPLLRMKMGTAGKERIMEEFSIDQMVNKYIGRYTMLMAK
jgi:glycosyltransferase involved in cell wall biosynthesis